MGLGRLIERASTPAPVMSGTMNGIGGAIGGSYGAALAPGGPGAGRAAPVSASGAGSAGWGSGNGEGAVTALSPAWRCLHILTDGISGLDIFAFDDDEDDRRIESPRVLADPWPVMSPVEWRAMVVASLILHGNAYLLPYDEDPRTGYPRQLAIVHPDQMRVELVNGRPRYWVNDNRVHELDVLHIRAYTPPGQILGLGVVEAMRRGIRLATDIEGYQMGNLEQASVPPVVIRVNRPEISEEQATDIQSRWVRRHGFGNRAPAVLPTSLEVTPIAWSPEDAQFLESKQYMAVEVCWWFGIDPRLLGLAAGGQSLTYSNIETTYVDLQRMSFMPYTTRIESSLSRVLPRNQMARFDFSPILRTTLQDRYASYAIGLEQGFLTIEEVRSLENMGPLGSGVEVGRPGRVESMRKQVNTSLPTSNTEATQ